ncbi:MAG: hypothetical protein ACXITV_12775 [Luteibaculaceae bacterium]
MKTPFRFLSARTSMLALAAVAVSLSACSRDDDDNNDDGTPPPPPAAWNIQAWFDTPDFNNRRDLTWTEAGLNASMFNPAVAPNLILPSNSPLRNAARWDNTPAADSFFEQVNYIGAFGDTDWTQGWVNWNPDFTPLPTGRPFVEVVGNITSNTTWTANNIYRLDGFVRVQDGATLTIEPGTWVVGKQGTKAVLIIQDSGMIMAEGTADNPIVMTSEQPVGQKEAGDWGGLVICGLARNNVAGGRAELEGGYGAFHGGTNDAHNSGVVKYVRIEYAGVPINPNEEVNSLTMGSVGSATTIEYVMTTYGLDDAFEWFGGTVNGKYLVAHRCLDDDLDIDLGYSGKNQFIYVSRAPLFADQSGSNLFEVDNDGQGSANTPFTSGVFANVTAVGPIREFGTAISAQYQNGAHLRRSNQLKVYNTVITGMPTGVFIDGQRTTVHAEEGQLQLRNVVLAGVQGDRNNGWRGNGVLRTNGTR